MDTVKQRYPEQKVSCPCTHCLNQVVKTWQEVKDNLLIYRMSPTYTTWIHHGEEGGGIDIIEPSDMRGSHQDGWTCGITGARHVVFKNLKRARIKDGHVVQ
jgi:hypothetical protein